MLRVINEAKTESRRSQDEIFGGLVNSLKSFNTNLNKLSAKAVSKILKIYCKDVGLDYGQVFNNIDTFDVGEFVDWFDLSGTTGDFIFEYAVSSDDEIAMPTKTVIELIKLDKKLSDIIVKFAIKNKIITPDGREVTRDSIDPRGKKVDFDTICHWVLNELNSMPDGKYEPEKHERIQAEKDVEETFMRSSAEDALREENAEFDKLGYSDKERAIERFIKANKEALQAEFAAYKDSEQYETDLEKQFQKNLIYPRSPEADKDIVDPELYKKTLKRLEKLYRRSVTEDLDEEDVTMDTEIEAIPNPSLEDDKEEVVEVEEETQEEVIESSLRNAVKDLVNQLMIDTWAFISKINSGITTIKFDFKAEEKDDILEILNGAADDATIIVGMLSKASSLLNDRALKFMIKGEKKADKLIGK